MWIYIYWKIKHRTKTQNWDPPIPSWYWCSLTDLRQMWKQRQNLQHKCQTTALVTPTSCGISKSLSDLKRNTKQDINKAIFLLAVHVVFHISKYTWHKIIRSTVNDSVYTCSSYIRLFCYLYTINLNQAPVKAIHKCQPQGKRQWSGLQ